MRLNSRNNERYQENISEKETILVKIREKQEKNREIRNKQPLFHVKTTKNNEKE